MNLSEMSRWCERVIRAARTGKVNMNDERSQLEAFGNARFRANVDRTQRALRMTDQVKKALCKVNDILSLDLVRTYANELEFKGITNNIEDGGKCKFYLDRSDLEELAAAFKILSESSDGKVEK